MLLFYFFYSGTRLLSYSFTLLLFLLFYSVTILLFYSFLLFKKQHLVFFHSSIRAAHESYGEEATTALRGTISGGPISHSCGMAIQRHENGPRQAQNKAYHVAHVAM